MIACNRAVFGLWLIALSLISEYGLPQTPAFRNTNAAVHYTGSKVCAGCHAEIYSSYSKTSMGRSLTSGADSSVLDRFPAPFTVFDNDAGEYFEVLRRQDGLYQSEYAVDRSGKEVFRETEKLAYVVGSGENGFGFIVQRGHYLFEAPLTYYSKSRVWSFSPGYEVRNLGFSRPVLAECIGCHAGRPEPVNGGTGLYRDPPFAELAVGCENCHGPGQLHVAERGTGRPASGRADDSIVNPARLSGWLSDNICMKCHQGGDVRVEQAGRRTEDFRPGTPLNSVLSIFKVPAGRDSEPQSVLLEHYFSMTLSKCFRLSGGKLRCTSCHDPHIQPSALNAATYYREKCLSCHETTACKAGAAERAKTSPGDNCAFCHMPRQTVTTITHAALTNHRIAARAEEPLPEEAFRADSDSGLIEVTAGAGDRPSTDPAILVQAYSSVIRERHDQVKPKLNELLDRLALGSPQKALVLSALARRAMTIGTPESSEEAIRYFRAAIRVDPRAYENEILLAAVLARRTRNQEAIQVLLEGMPANPYIREFPEALAVQYMAVGQYGEALKVIRNALPTFPDDMTLRRLQKKAASATLDGSGSVEP